MEDRKWRGENTIRSGQLYLVLSSPQVTHCHCVHLLVSLRANSPTWASDARSSEARFARPNRRACSQANL